MDNQGPTDPRSGTGVQPPQTPESNQLKKTKSGSTYPTPTAPSVFTPSPGLSESTPAPSNPAPTMSNPVPVSGASTNQPNSKWLIILIAVIIFVIGIGVGIALHANVLMSTTPSNDNSQVEEGIDATSGQQAPEKSDDLSGWARDNHRKADIDSTHTSLEVYYNDYGYYPPESVYENESTAKVAFPEIDIDTLIDPSGNFINSSNGDYLYLTDGCGDKCQSYELMTVLEGDDGVYTKNSMH